jgi:hypothetical protein
MVIIFFESISNVLFRPIHATGNIKSMTIQTSIVYLSILLVSYLGFKFFTLPFYFSLILTGLAMIVIIAIKLIIIRKLIPKFSINSFIMKGIIETLYVVIPASVPVLFLWLLLEDGFLRFALIIIVSILSMAIFTYYAGINNQQRKKVTNYCLSKIKKS